MNNRDYKSFAQGEYYHVYNRGNNKAPIFHDAADYQLFLNRLSEAIHPERLLVVKDAHSQRNQRKLLPVGAFTLVAYCLMPNHFHLLIRQNTELPVSTVVSKLCSSYSKLFNKKYKRTGALFQDQFKSVLVGDDVYLKWLSAYIHQNPTVARLVRLPESYSYSSYKEYLHTGQDGLCEKSIITEQFKSLVDYQLFVSDALGLIQEKKELEQLLID